MENTWSARSPLVTADATTDARKRVPPSHGGVLAQMTRLRPAMAGLRRGRPAFSRLGRGKRMRKEARRMMNGGARLPSVCESF